MPNAEEQGLHITVADPQSKTLAGSYRENDIAITFEVTRGEPSKWIHRILNGEGPYETHGCFRNSLGQPILVIEDCVLSESGSTGELDDEIAGRSYQLTIAATVALQAISIPGLEAEKDFLVKYASIRPTLQGQTSN